jgi:hypothetical protein
LNAALYARSSKDLHDVSCESQLRTLRERAEAVFTWYLY